VSGFKVGDEVVIVNRDRGGVIEETQESRNGGLLYFVRFSDGQFLIYREHELGLKSDFAKDKQLATLRCVRELLLSDEFVDALAKRMIEKFSDAAFKPFAFKPFVRGVDSAKGDSVTVDYEWTGKESEVKCEQ
jgi:hypothetical protein